MPVEQKNKKYHILTFGCQMNKSDSERIASIFEQYDVRHTPETKEADFIIMNTCSIRQTAEDRVVGMARNFTGYKKDNPDLKVIITGCMAPRADAWGKASGVDLVLQIKELPLLPQKLGLERVSDAKIASDYLTITPSYTNQFQAYIPIMTGCNNFCTFCVVPFTRGREYSRPMGDILTEVTTAVEKGVKEIVLLGQNVNSYAYGFVDLLKRIDEIPGDFWVRFVSSNPQDMSTDLIDFVAEGKKMCKYLHFAVQSGNNRILKRMNRRHTVDQYLALCDRMKEKMPDLGLSTDVIVGFPSETIEEFNDTIALFKKVGFDMAYISQYSARSGTPAWRMKDDVSKEEKKRREFELNDILKESSALNAQKYLGTTRRILVERLNRQGQLCGKDTGFRTVNILNSSDETLIGAFVDVVITEARAFGLYGEIK